MSESILLIIPEETFPKLVGEFKECGFSNEIWCPQTSVVHDGDGMVSASWAYHWDCSIIDNHPQMDDEVVLESLKISGLWDRIDDAEVIAKLPTGLYEKIPQLKQLDDELCSE